MFFITQVFSDFTYICMLDLCDACFLKIMVVQIINTVHNHHGKNILIKMGVIIAQCHSSIPH